MIPFTCCILRKWLRSFKKIENNNGDRFSPCLTPFNRGSTGRKDIICNDLGFNIFVKILNDGETFSVYMMFT